MHVLELPYLTYYTWKYVDGNIDNVIELYSKIYKYFN